MGYDSILNQIKIVCRSPISLNDKLKKICELLKENIPYYDWVGFYFVDKSKLDELILGPFVGEPTEHVRIPFGHGICGQAAEKKETFIIQDVTKEPNYLSCSIKVKSEIVIPIFKNRKIIGEIDIDSHSVSPFTNDDKKFLEGVSVVVTDLF
ncbi:MAG: GAF domain-containing protein [Candidatus Cloacimonetes bacterium]|nr:GAF domain-containing protein [Candidatus Cloacimonadota bacterium]